MLNGHPRLALPRESHFITELTPRRPDRPPDPELLERILEHPMFARWGADAATVRVAVGRADPSTYAELIDAVFRAYAQAQGRPRWGDKTPRYVVHIPLLARLFPGAQFVHVIRDGREVATSVAEQSWGARTGTMGALWWRRHVAIGIRHGRRLGPGRYRELRLEDLVAAPERALRGLCEFLDEAYAPEMLEYPARIAVSRSQLGPDTRHLLEPPTSALRDWRAGLTLWQQRSVTAVCRPLLTELGYPAPHVDPAGLACAHAARLGELLARPSAVIRDRVDVIVRNRL